MSLLASSLPDLQKKCAPARVLAVSKKQSIEKILELYQQGQRDFAENYVQEFREKTEALKEYSDIRWHFIGHLQRNKAKLVVGAAYLIHSLDSIELAEALDHRAEQLQIQQKVLIQVNLAQEESKGGFSKEEILKFYPLLCKFPHLTVCGLMCMPPLSQDPELVRPFFKELKDLLIELNKQTPHASSELSMGTSADYAVAVQEGATIVRLGTVLFGERSVKN